MRDHLHGVLQQERATGQRCRSDERADGGIGASLEAGHPGGEQDQGRRAEDDPGGLPPPVVHARQQMDEQVVPGDRHDTQDQDRCQREEHGASAAHQVVSRREPDDAEVDAEVENSACSRTYPK